MANSQVYTGGLVGNNASIVMVTASGGTPTTPGTVLSDTLFLAKPTSGVMFGVAGTASVTMTDGTGGPFKVLAGVMYPWAVKQFKTTGNVTLTSQDIYLFYGPRNR